MYTDIKKLMASRGYSSVSEFMRDAARKFLYPELTENGFTPEFEDIVLRAEAEPQDQDYVWETEKDIHTYFNNLRKKLRKNDKSKKSR